MFLLLFLLSKAEVEAHNVSHMPPRSRCSACVRGRGLSLGHQKVDTKIKEAKQVPTVSVDCERVVLGKGAKVLIGESALCICPPHRGRRT